MKYCRYISQHMTAEGLVYVLICWKALLKYFEQNILSCVRLLLTCSAVDLQHVKY